VRRRLQLIPGISPLNPASSIVPLVFVLLVTAVKEAFEDIVRCFALGSFSL
jgi:phospholipid-transporting ATPase